MPLLIEDVARSLNALPVGDAQSYACRTVDQIYYDDRRYESFAHHLRALLPGSAYGAFVFERRADTGALVVTRQPPGRRVYDDDGFRLPARLEGAHARLA